MTFQVPGPGYVMVSGNEPITTYPDELFMFIKNDRLTFGKEQGFLHLSREGYSFFRNDIWDAYSKRPFDRTGAKVLNSINDLDSFAKENSSIRSTKEPISINKKLKPNTVFNKVTV